MRLTLFGANGPTGRLLTTQALAAGHHVVAVTRHPETFPVDGDRLTVQRGDAYDPASVAAAVDRSDAVARRPLLGVRDEPRRGDADPSTQAARRGQLQRDRALRPR